MAHTPGAHLFGPANPTVSEREQFRPQGEKKKKRGRPKGSKNRPKGEKPAETVPPSPSSPPPPAKKRTRKSSSSPKSSGPAVPQSESGVEHGLGRQQLILDLHDLILRRK